MAGDGTYWIRLSGYQGRTIEVTTTSGSTYVLLVEESAQAIDQQFAGPVTVTEPKGATFSTVVSRDISCGKPLQYYRTEAEDRTAGIVTTSDVVSIAVLP